MEAPHFLCKEFLSTSAPNLHIFQRSQFPHIYHHISVEDIQTQDFDWNVAGVWEIVHGEFIIETRFIITTMDKDDRANIETNEVNQMTLDPHPSFEIRSLLIERRFFSYEIMELRYILSFTTP